MVPVCKGLSTTGPKCLDWARPVSRKSKPGPGCIRPVSTINLQLNKKANYTNEYLNRKPFQRRALTRFLSGTLKNFNLPHYFSFPFKKSDHLTIIIIFLLLLWMKLVFFQHSHSSLQFILIHWKRTTMERMPLDDPRHHPPSRSHSRSAPSFPRVFVFPHFFSRIINFIIILNPPHSFQVRQSWGVKRLVGACSHFWMPIIFPSSFLVGFWRCKKKFERCKNVCHFEKWK